MLGDGSQAIRDACRDADPLAECLAGAAWGLRLEARRHSSSGYLLAHTGLLVREGEERARKSSNQRNSLAF